jgi:acyl-CoA synthetase (AMP-forming)/AMP-acid ligase II
MKPFLVQHLLELSSEKFPDKVAVTHGAQGITFEDLYARSGALGYGLQKFGMRRGERVGILLDKSIGQVAAMLGALRADVIFVLINSILKENQIRHILNDCGIKLLIAAEKYSDRFQNILEDTQVEKVVWESELDGRTAAYAGKNVQNRRSGEDIGSIIYTSGSTGLPKGIVITHRNLIDGARIVSHYLVRGVQSATVQNRSCSAIPGPAIYQQHRRQTAGSDKNSGAYGLTASPVFFLGHETPREILIKDGQARVIRESKDITEFN